MKMCIFLLFLLILLPCWLTWSTLEDAGLFPECPGGLAVSLHWARLSALLTSAGRGGPSWEVTAGQSTVCTSRRDSHNRQGKQIKECVCVCVLLRKCMCRGNRRISKPVDQPSTSPFRPVSVTYFLRKSVTSFRRRALWHVSSSVDCHSLRSSAVMCLRANSTTEDTQVVSSVIFLSSSLPFFFFFLTHSCDLAWEPHWGSVKSDCIVNSVWNAPWTGGPIYNHH